MVNSLSLQQVANDFTQMHFKFLGLTLYHGYVRGGLKAATNFETDKISKQAFFTYFYVSEQDEQGIEEILDATLEEIYQSLRSSTYKGEI